MLLCSSGVTILLCLFVFCLRFFVFIRAEALGLIVPRYACAPQPLFLFCLFYCFLEVVFFLFPSIFVPFIAGLFFVWRVPLYVSLQDCVVFFCLVTTGWILASSAYYVCFLFDD